MFVLLLLGFVFLGIINRNILQSTASRERSRAADLADAGIRYSQSQLVSGILGADWTPDPTPPITRFDSAGNPIAAGAADPAGPVFTTDPDIFYTRAPSLNDRGQSAQLTLRDTDLLADKGGPDGLGPFSRVQFANGRALIRVRYAPSDIDITQASASGPLREPGKAHSYIIIESIGRPGFINPSDPTTLGNSARVQFQHFTTNAELRTAVAAMSDRDNQLPISRKLIAFADVGIIDYARFISDKDRTTRPADIGIPYENGVMASDGNGVGPVDVHVPEKLGESIPVHGGQTQGGGSIYSNANLFVHGMLDVSVNLDLGEGIFCAGNITGGNSIKNPGLAATILLRMFRGSTETDATLTTGGGDNLSSNSPNFDTELGTYRDGRAATDANGNPRYVPYKTPPDFTIGDRYRLLTRDSGVILTGGNSGQYGQGQGVYVNNVSDSQALSDQSGKLMAGSQEALFYDWLNPNNGQPNSYWHGPFYVPPGAYLQLEPDGFIITRDAVGPAAERTWRDQNGNDSGLTSIRYRIEPPTVQPRHIINTLTPGVNINDANPNFSAGQPFDGVLFFEGNVRVRGTIPTDTQITVVSMGTIYIEGSITKGVQQTSGSNQGTLIGTAPKAMLGLMAKDYVAVNTTQFFGPAENPVTEKNSTQNPTGLDPVVMAAANGQLNFVSEELLDPDPPTGTLSSSWLPTSWHSYASEYRQPSGAGTGAIIPSRLLLTHTMDDGPAPDTYVSLDINYGANAPTSSSNYFFPLTTGNDVMYPLGQESWQRYSRFESRWFPILTMPPDSQPANQPQINAQQQGTYIVNLQRSTPFDFRPNNKDLNPTNDYLLARAAIVPQDVRIEAMIYAQDGSFFVIPGQWFNPNPNDRKDLYNSLGTNDAERQQARLENYGNYPEAPFYGEPLDVRVTILGAISENMPPPITQQAQWIKKWGWIPREHGASGELIPTVHIPNGYDVTNPSNPDAYLYVPNLIVKYDPVLAGGRVNGFDPTSNAVRLNPLDPTGTSILPPLPALPVSPTLFYFGEVNP